MSSRSVPVGLLFVIPLWALYEILAYSINEGFAGQLRTGIDLLLKMQFQMLKLPVELLIILPAVLLIFFFVRKDTRLYFKDLPGAYFGYMLLECLVYGVLFGLLVNKITSLFLILNLNSEANFNSLNINTFTVNLGAGVYEEIFFRLFLLYGLVFLLRKMDIENLVLLYAPAIILSASAFAAFHHLELFGEEFNSAVFLFRAVSGVVLAFLFILRGIGITTYTHTFYNIFLMFRAG